MVQVLKNVNRGPSSGEKFNKGMENTMQQVFSIGNMLMQKEQEGKETAKLKQMGIDVEGLSPEVRKMVVESRLKGDIEERKQQSKYGERLKMMEEFTKRNKGLGLDSDTQPPSYYDEIMLETTKKKQLPEFMEGTKRGRQPQQEQYEAEPEPEARPAPKIRQRARQPEAPAPRVHSQEDILAASMIDPQVANQMQRYNDQVLSQQRHKENIALKKEQFAEKEKQADIRQKYQETLPIRQEIANKAQAARQGIQNKEHLLNLIEKGNMDDPTFATLAEALPLNLGKRLLSTDTVEYKAGLIEEFGDLRNLFKGATRVKEIDLLEQKIADLYLTDDQKKAILKSRIKALQADVIRAEAAAELEGEPIGILNFESEVNKRAKPKLDALFDQVLDEQKAIIKDAENKKKLPLDDSLEEDRSIIDSILKEAETETGLPIDDPTTIKKAERIAKEKGYKFQ